MLDCHPPCYKYTLSTPHLFVHPPRPSSILPWSKQSVYCILHKFCPMETLKFHHGDILILFSSIYWFGILALDVGAFFFCFLIHMLGWHSTSWCKCFFPFSSICWVGILPLDADVIFLSHPYIGFTFYLLIWMVFSFFIHMSGLAFYLLIRMFFLSFLIHILGSHSTSWYGWFFPFSSICRVGILPLDTDVFFSLSHPYVGLVFYLLIRMFFFLSHPSVGSALCLLIQIFRHLY